jgi:hypothetical protein
MNEAETRAERIDPKLKTCGWSVVGGSIALYIEYTIIRNSNALRTEIQKLVAVYQKKIEQLEELKKSVLQKAFAGELLGGTDTEQSRSTESKTEKALAI